MDRGRDSPHSSKSRKDKATFEARPPVNGKTPNLPEEIMVEILARLPVKSLLRFRCVSKSWLTLISSQQFIKTHLNFSRQNLSNYGIMVTISDPIPDLQYCSLSSLMHEPSAYVWSIDYPEEHPSIPVWVVGSCNGLICLALDQEDLFLWNPSTRKSRKLPPANFDIKPGFSNKHCYGFHESHDDYKVVGIFLVWGNGDACKSRVKIYSSKTNSWKRVEDFKGGFPLDDTGKFASGKFHWSTSGNTDIVSLDMESEVYGIVEQPNYTGGKFDLILGVLGECICVLCNYEISADLWVLKEYGVKESWTKVATVPYVDTSGSWYSKPLVMLRNGEILLVFGMYFVAYNLKENSICISEISNLEFFEDADIYVESLVSPVADGLALFHLLQMDDKRHWPLNS